jgi:hypothetical protein
MVDKKVRATTLRSWLCGRLTVQEQADADPQPSTSSRDALTQMTELVGCRHPAAGMCEARDRSLGHQPSPSPATFGHFGSWWVSTCEGGDRIHEAPLSPKPSIHSTL